MMNWKMVILLGMVALVANAREGGKPPKLSVSSQPIDRDARLATSYASIVKRVAPSVVNIYSTRRSRAPQFIHPFLDDPMFRRFFGDPYGGGRPEPRKTQSLGSGVIVSEDGYLLTNNHVVEGADEVKVVLHDGKTEYDARIVGRDPQTDIAVLKVEATKLKAVTLADSDKLEVGDVVLAVGNPFGIGQTVTHGIISALGRSGFGITEYEDFIQTDAAINPGNSGGALVDTDGRLIGINQSIVSRSGGASGVGFAVPINLARIVLDRLVTDGRITRGYLGVSIQPLTPALVRKFKLSADEGAFVSDVSPDTPAAEAGLLAGDVITELDGKKITDSQHLRLIVAQTPPSTKVTLKVLRDGREKTITATLARLPDALGGQSESVDEPGSSGGGPLEGVGLTDLNARFREEHGIPANIRGAFVTNVEQDSAAAEAGLRPGDVIVEVERQPARNAEAVRELSRRSNGDGLALRVWSQSGGIGATRYLVIESPKKK